MEPDKEKAESVLLAILSHADDGLGRTKLYKAFWLAHLHYHQANADFLTDWPVVKMPNGPGVNDGDSLLADLIQRGKVEQKATPVGRHTELRCRAADDASVDGLSVAAHVAIREAVRFVESKTADMLSDMSHRMSRSWNQRQMGEELDIYSDLIPDEEYAALEAASQGAREAVDAIFQ